MQKNERSFIVTESTLNSTLSYLAKKPFNEVANLISLLQRSQELKQVENSPVKPEGKIVPIIRKAEDALLIRKAEDALPGQEE